MRDTDIEINSYDPMQRDFHWLMAAVILTAICVGVYAADLPKEDATRGFWFGIHKSLGMTVFFLAIMRIGLRLYYSAPRYRVALGRFTALAAWVAHSALYILMVGVPIGGYVLSTASGHPVSWFGLFTFPSVVPVDKSLAEIADDAHVTGALILVTVIALHITAAIWHHWFKHDEVMARMAPCLARKVDVQARRRRGLGEMVMHVLEHEKGDGPTSESHGQGNRGERGQSKDRAEAQPVRTHGFVPYWAERSDDVSNF